MAAFFALGPVVLSGLFLSLSLRDEDKAPPEEPKRIAELYPPVPFAKVADGKWLRPRASIIGVVKDVNKESDGDWHIALTDGGKLVVCEIIPELPMKQGHPKKGDKIRIWGVCREDKWHGWFELHPVVGWEIVK